MQDSKIKTIKKKVVEIEEMIGSLTDNEKNALGVDTLEVIDEIFKIYKMIMGVKPIYKKVNGEIEIDHWDMPTVEQYSFEQFELKQLIDWQFKLAGYLGYIGNTKARFEANSGLNKAIIEIASRYVFTDAKSYISETLLEKATLNYIDSIIQQPMLKKYAKQRVSASLAKLLDTIYRAGELMRNVLKSTVDFMREDITNSMHLAQAQT